MKSVIDSAKVTVPSVVEAAVSALRGLIVTGAARPGERLVEERLTEWLGVSRPPLREALRILQRDGLVESLPRRGYRVVSLTAEDVREIYSLRFTLERMAIELGVPVRDRTRLKPMHDALAGMQLATESNDARAMLAANSLFHAGLVGLPAHKRLEAVYDSIRLQVELCMADNLRFRDQQFGDQSDAYPRHARLLESIEIGDKEAALYDIEHHGALSFVTDIDNLAYSEDEPR
ncbi:GntR family transcriptional regulator [Leifsonia sp. NPDC056665]|uniref:GntR family transcriptional regulator n=1 Tax=Leifsonia sp. NPDC056665 TaxID=3345901 RepID=UPI0036761B45